MVKTLPSNRGAAGSILGQGAKILHALQAKKNSQKKKKKHNIKQKQYCNKFYRDFKNGPHQKKKKISCMSLMTPSITWSIYNLCVFR